MELSAGSSEAFAGASARLGSSNSTPSRDSSPSPASKNSLVLAHSAMAQAR
jgi:hypothetical protein